MTDRYPAVLIFGPPGSGKGTQGKFLCSSGNHYHLSSGDIFRGLSPESPSGKLFHQFASKGKFVPDDITIDIWKRYVSGLIDTNQYFPKNQLLLLDGIPRTLNQAKILDQHVDVLKIISLESEDTEIFINRIKRRALIERRHDDSDESVLRARMDLYNKETKDVLRHYKEEIICRYNADQKPLEVLRDILIDLSETFS
ncbi:MAG: nucleoside monophosphate kinase [Simkaniaceae bacterium]|nr:nucleoside monophosphate kinase [Simkaniaceae bacterium]